MNIVNDPLLLTYVVFLLLAAVPLLAFAWLIWTNGHWASPKKGKKS